MTGPLIFEPEYYDRLAAHEAGSWWNAGMRDAALLLLSRVGLPPQGRLLDVGCGTGQTMEWLLHGLAGWQAVGCDLARPGLSLAKSHGASVAEASALQLPFARQSADLVVCLDVLQHLPLPDGDVEVLQEIRRVLRPGGLLLLRTNAQAWPRTVEDPVYNFRKYTTRALRRALGVAGFHVMRLGRLNALLGLAEIPRELRRQREFGDGYTGHPAAVPARDRLAGMKRRWLALEGRLVATGWSLPLGRSHLVLARTREE